MLRTMCFSEFTQNFIEKSLKLISACSYITLSYIFNKNTHWSVILFMKGSTFLYIDLTFTHFRLLGKDPVFNASFTHIHL